MPQSGPVDQQILDLLANMVIEVADAVGLLHLQMEW